MVKPWEKDDDFLLYLNSADRGTFALEPGETTVRSAFRQTLEIPLDLSADYKVSLLRAVYFHSFGNAVLAEEGDYHAAYEDWAGKIDEGSEIRLSPHKNFTHVKHVLQDPSQKLHLFTMPPLSGGKHHYGQLHLDSPSSYSGPSHLMNPKLDFFRKDIAEIMRLDIRFPTSFLDMQNYLKTALRLLVGARWTSEVWTVKRSVARPGTHYALELWAQGSYDFGESLALFMGFLEPDPNRPNQTRIVAHNRTHVDTGRHYSDWQVTRLDTHHVGIEDEDYQLGGVRLRLNVAVDDLPGTLGSKFVFDMGAWIRSPSGHLPFTTVKTGATLIALSPARFTLQVHPNRNLLRFNHGVEEIFGVTVASSVGFRRTLLLPDLDTPIDRFALENLSNADLSKCFVELDIVEPSWRGSRFRKTLMVLPLNGRFGQTVEYHPPHLDFRPLVAPLRGTKELQVHLRNDRDLGVLFYTGLVGLWLYFHKHPQTMSSLVQGGRRVTLESSAQRDLYPDNSQSSFKCLLPDKWQLDHTWEVALMQLLLPHTWRNVYRDQVGFRVHYDNTASHTNVKLTLKAGSYVTVRCNCRWSPTHPPRGRYPRWRRTRTDSTSGRFPPATFRSTYPRGWLASWATWISTRGRCRFTFAPTVDIPSWKS